MHLPSTKNNQTLKDKFFIITTLLTLWFFSNCVQGPGMEAVPAGGIGLKNPDISLNASERMRTYFEFLQKDYIGPEVFEVLSALREPGNQTCEMIYSRMPYEKEEIKKFTNIELGSPIKTKFYLRTLRRIIAGCWNFFQMNDISPDKDFEYIKNQYPNAKFNCYSVGFMQPYIMHSILDCETLSLLDIDIRILEGHAQLVKGFHEGKLQTKEEIKEYLQGLKLGWIAQHRPFQSETPVNLQVFCPRDPEMCLENLVTFQRKYKSLKKLNFYASALHEANMVPEQEKVSVVFLSNAFEDYYTKRKEFDSLMERLESELGIGQKIVFINHNGGRHLFGVYEVERKEDTGLQVNAICRDRYLFYPEEEGRTYYNIHLDRWKGLKVSGKSCSTRQVPSQLVKKKGETENQ
jgi:hypothetical protein